MSTALGTGLHGGPSITRQIVRASVGTFTVLAVIGALVAAIVYGRDTATRVWWWAVGDSAVVLAEGTTLSDAAPSAVAPVMASSTASLATSLDELTAPFGGDAVLVSTAAQLRAEAPYADPVLWSDRTDLSAPMAVTPMGVVQVEPARDGIAGSVRLLPGPDAPVVVGDAAQREFVARMARAAAAVGGSTLDVTPHPVRIPAGASSSTWMVELGLPGCDVCRVGTWDAVVFDADGRLTYAAFTLASITGVVPITAPSAQQAFDDARHHRGETSVWMNGAPIGAATLTVADLGAMQRFTAWNFTDTTGMIVAQVPVPPEA